MVRVARSRRLRDCGRWFSDSFIWVKQLSVFVECKTICHTGNVVRYDPRLWLFIAADPIDHVSGHLPRFAHVRLEEFCQHPDRLLGHPEHAKMSVEALCHDFFELNS